MSTKGFAAASWVVLLGWLVSLAAAVLVVGAAVSSATGWSADYRDRIDLIPGTSLLRVEVAPTWGVVGDGDICGQVRIRDYPTDCYGFVVQHGEQHLDGDVVLPADIRAEHARLTGEVVLNADGGWRPLLVSILAMRAAGFGVLAVVLYQLWRILRSAAGGEPFARSLVRRLYVMGIALIAWEVVEPLAWLWLSPKAFDYTGVSYGPVPGLELGPMEPGGPNLAVIGFGVLLILLALVFRHGAELAEEQRLTV